LWLESRRALREGTRESSARAVTLLQRAIARDSNYSDAWAALAEAMYANDMWRGTPPAEQALRGRTVAQKAIDLDPLNGFAYVQRGWWRAQYDWAWADAWGDLRQAVRLAPASPDVAANYAGFLSVVVEPESAVVQSRRAMAMDPSNPGMWTLLGSRFMLAGMTDSGIVASERAVALNAADFTAHTILMLLFARSGRMADAARHAERVWELDGEMPNALFLATYYRLVRDTAGARRLLATIRGRPASQFVPHSTIAAAQLALGNRAAALDGLELAAKERDLELPYSLLFWFGPLHGEPRFEGLRKQVFGNRVLAPSPF
jgi:Tfp pilus assembly protein PilF